MRSDNRPRREDGDPGHDDKRDLTDDDERPPQATTAGWMPWGVGWGWGASYLPWYPRNADEPVEETDTADGEESHWDESLFSLLLIAGVILFIFPEPVTSFLGVFLLLTGAIGWLVSEIL